MRRRHLWLMLSLFCVPHAARADELHLSAQRAREAVAQGLIRPLEELFAITGRLFIGRIVEAELSEEAGRWSYEFELLPPNGQIFQVYIDAATGAILRTEGPVQRQP